MSDNTPFGFGKFVPGFDFLQNIAKGASQAMPQVPNLSHWVAPTLNLEELEKRISELKAVHFWLDQNSKALGATIQALEVQKMTLATLKGMNFNMGDLADAFKLKPAGTGPGAGPGVAQGAGAAPVPDAAGGGAAATTGRAARGKAKPAAEAKAAAATPGSGVVDPLQWWGALTQQFQQIAADAMKEATTPAAGKNATKNAPGGKGGGARKSAGAAPGKAARRPAKKPNRA